MQGIRYGFIVLSMLLCLATSAVAEVRIGIGIGLPNMSIGINLPLYPQLVPVSGYPVYYAPRLNANYFFYDGMYWVFQNDSWYASSWYNGPWWFVEPVYVPLFILRIPVRYYRQPPIYFRGWRSSAPPRWDNHWGPEWEQQRRGWDRWQRSAVPARAPLPVYQKQYSGDQYPRVEQQHDLRKQKYRYQPQEPVIREHFQQRLDQQATEPSRRERQEEPLKIKPRQQDTQRPTPPQQDSSRGTSSQPQTRGDDNIQRSAPDQKLPHQPPAIQREQQQRSQDQKQQTSDREEERENKNEERGRGRNN
ncbi:MAG TPA: hypothetical protein DEQ20_01960 [Desulfobulbaceae bacterium]|nr:MAG: hypothetical protein A2520_11430 [Deltaproteobacteria bacterium RIFOXYD12_FULL_53_23]HCC53684.1 hypothetical protein [Desulfobulbaceae bacterium]